MSEPAPRRRGLAAGLIVAALVSAGLAAGGWYFLHERHGQESPPHRGEPPPPDPRTTYAGPFVNITPDMRYVGSAACGGAGCHDDKIASYRHHPMGRSMFPAADVDPPPPEDSAHHNPFTALATRFRVARDGGRVWHHREALDEAGRPIYDFALSADYAIGSGSHGHSYLAVREGGYVVQSPVSWYSQKQTWDLSPGFGEALAAGRPVVAECLFCHANHTEPVEGTINRFQEPVFDGLAIGCERCHGPGEKHVAARRNREPVAGGTDTTIVNPGRLTPALREAVCEQCHLPGEARVVRRGRHLNDFRPGLPLEEFVSTFVRATEGERDNKAVNHVEQMHASRCFRASAGDNKLGCVSCHDPHVHVVEPAERVRHYRAACLACHEQHGCSLPRDERVKTSPQDSCIDCHMPRQKLGNIPHTAATDHRILRRYRPEDEPRTGPLSVGRGSPVVAFHAPTGAPPGPELERDLGIALMGPLVERQKIDARAASALGLRLLESAVARDPDDLDAGEARANALWAQGRSGDALAALETVLAVAPRRETALARAGLFAQSANRPEAAIDYWRRAAEVNPWLAAYRRSLCGLLVHKKAWDELRPHSEAWLRLDPASVDARQTWVSYLLHAGRKDEARAEFDKVRALRPANLARLQAWFDEESK
jgi:hypothetical protein